MSKKKNPRAWDTDKLASILADEYYMTPDLFAPDRHAEPPDPDEGDIDDRQYWLWFTDPKQRKAFNFISSGVLSAGYIAPTAGGD